jgi:hypothetical protein
VPLRLQQPGARLLKRARRLSEAALDILEAGRPSGDAVCQRDTTRTAMHLALGNILNAFGYRTKPHSLGHFVLSGQP